MFARRLLSGWYIVEVYGSESPALVVEPDSVMINPTTYDALVKSGDAPKRALVLRAAGGSTAGVIGGTATLTFPSIPSAGCASD